MDPILAERVRRFIADDVDPEARAELGRLLDAGDERALTDRFSGPLEFGTAGLRGLIGAGESRMNRAVVIRATKGLVDHVLASVPNARERGIVIGRDARRMSPELQLDAAEVVAGAGVRVHWLEGPTPTPVVAFATSKLGAAAGITITASHNPPAYNGYKVYWENGAQIIPPIDRAIAAAILAAPGAKDVARRPVGEARAAGLVVAAESVKTRYVEEVAGLVFDAGAPVGSLSIAYSALHGVGEPFVRAVFERRGFGGLRSVREQAEPDGAFPTVDFPNPEEPAALERVLALARTEASDLVLVNDPDADRLGVAVRDSEGGYVVLNGNEIGVLLAHHVITHDGGGDPRLVIATIVSSQLLRRMAAAFGVGYAETLTGFKWIANEAIRREGEARFLFGYEEALGYTVGTLVRDKDGIGAALVMAEMAAALKGRGLTLLDQLEAIRFDHGFFASRTKSLTLPGREGAEAIGAAMKALRGRTIDRLGSTVVTATWDLSADPRWTGDVLVYTLADGGRVSVRPSGTEPKIKLYLEVVEQPGTGTLADASERAERRLDDLERATLTAAGL
jgi:phosphomannomutase